MIDKKKFNEEDIMMFVDGELSPQRSAEIESIINSNEKAKALAQKYRDSSNYLHEAFSHFDFSKHPRPSIKKVVKTSYIETLKKYVASFSFAQGLAIPVTAVLFVFVGFQLSQQNVTDKKNTMIFKGGGSTQINIQLEKILNENAEDLPAEITINGINIKFLSSEDNCKSIEAKIANKTVNILACYKNNVWKIVQLNQFQD